MTSKLCGANTASVTDFMSRFSKHHQHWDEFRWEEEIRKDERRISGYFHELGACLDLPDEEQLIYDQLAGRNDLVIAETPDSVRNIFSDEDDDADTDSHSPRRSIESATVDELDMLAAEWNILTCTETFRKDQPLILGCSCAFAKLLARCADFLEPDADCTPFLLISTGKRTLRDLNETVQFLSRAAQSHPELQEDVERFISRLGEIRERLISRLISLR